MWFDLIYVPVSVSGPGGIIGVLDIRQNSTCAEERMGVVLTLPVGVLVKSTPVTTVVIR